MANINQHKISVIGLGYVGCVTSSCLAYLRHKVIGVDIDREKIDLINNAKTPIEEPLLSDFLKFGLKHKYLEATDNLEYAINNTDITFVCVCTPPQDDGSCNLNYLINLTRDIGRIIRKKSYEHVIVIRSTIPPGTMQDQIIPILEMESGKQNNKDFYTCFHPEFLREGSATSDFFNPPKYIIGENNNQHAGDRILEILLLNQDQHNIIRTNYKTAELVKYTDNVWHALKVTFANEIGSIANSYGINSHELMEIFCSDKKLNISNYYLRPGLSYGGSCLPKDLQSMQYLVSKSNLNLPVIEHISTSNEVNIQRTYDFIKKYAHGKIGWHGVSFKDNTDDLRNSVHLDLISRLNQEYKIKIYDSNIDFQHLTQDKKQLFSKKISNYKDLVVYDFLKLIDSSDTLVIGHEIKDYKNALLQYPKQLNIIDLANINININETHHNYHGLFW